MTPPALIDHDAELVEYARLLRWCGPTVAEWQAHMGFSSTSVAAYHLRALEWAGYISIVDGVARGHTLTRDGINRLKGFGIDIVAWMNEEAIKQ